MLISVLLIVCGLFLPGFTLSLVLFPRMTSLDVLERFGVSIVFGFILLSITGLLLIFFNIFSSFAIYLCVGFEILLFFTISALRYKVLSGLYDYFAAREFLKDKALLFPIFIIVVIACLSLTYIHRNVSLNTTACFYMAQGKLIAQTGSFPTKVFEWGGYREALCDKVLFNVFTAVIIKITNLDYISIMKVMSFIFLLVALIGAFLFYKQFFSTTLAVCGILFTFANPLFIQFIVIKFLAFRGEASGLMFFFMFLYTLSRALFHKERIFLFLSIALLITMGTWHSVPFVVAFLIFGSLYISKWIISFRISREEIRSFLLVAICVPIGMSFVLLAGKAFRFRKIIENVMNDETKFSLYKDKYDPTWEFTAKLSGFNHRGIKYGSGFYRPAGDIYRWAIIKALYIPRVFMTHKQFLLEFSVVAIVVLGFLLWRIEREDKVLLLTSVGLFLAIILMGLYFSYTYCTYIPAEHVTRREINYCFLPGVIVLLLCCKYLVRLIIPEKRRAFSIVFLLICCVYFLALTNNFLKEYENTRYSVDKEGDFLSEHGLQTLKWLKENTAESEIIMSNLYTGGSFYLFSDRKSITEGRAPYLEEDILMDALTIMDDIQLFFMRPNIQVLKKYDIAYVILAPPQGLLGINFIYQEIDKEAINRTQFLKRVRSFGEINVYKVVY